MLNARGERISYLFSQGARRDNAKQSSVLPWGDENGDDLTLSWPANAFFRTKAFSAEIKEVCDKEFGSLNKDLPLTMNCMLCVCSPIRSSQKRPSLPK